MPRTDTCSGCGARVRVVIVNGQDRTLDLDASGRPTKPHVCGMSPTAAAQPAPIASPAATAPATTQPGTGTAPATAAPIAPSATPINVPNAIPGVDQVFAELERLDREDEAKRRREAANHHKAIARHYDATKRGSMTNGAVPAIDPDYVIDRDMFAAIARVCRIARDTGEPQNMGFQGEPGSGKTTLGIQIGAIMRAPTFVVDAGAKQTADEWYTEATGIDRDSGRVIIEPSDFVRGIETPGAVVVINDVANMQNRTVQNGLNELLDPSTRTTYSPSLGRAITVAPGVIIAGTWNVGTVSSSEISEQIISRFGAGCLFEVPLANNGELTRILVKRTGISEIGARRLADFADWMRGDADPIPVDTRRLIAAATQITQGATTGHAIAYTVLGNLSVDERTRAFAIIDVSLGDADEDERAEWHTPVVGQGESIELLARQAGLYSTSDSSDSGDSSDSDEGTDEDERA